MNDKHTMTLGNKSISYEFKTIDESKLFFDPENPRIYSLINRKDEEPTQDEIYEQLKSMDHVKTLKSSIMSNGGVIDPLLVKDNGNDTYTVLEGNSRLAAIRMICSYGKDLANWAQVRCNVFPNTISEKDVFALLGQYHLIGRKDWDAYEQASYLYRRNKETGIPIKDMARELGLTEGNVKKMIDTITFMEDNNDTDKRHYSYYYDVYLKNKAIKKYRDTMPELDKTIVKMVKTGKVTDAKDFRKLGDIAKQTDSHSKKIMKEIAEGKLSLYDGYNQVAQSGKLGTCVQQLKRFRDCINDDKIIDEINSSKETYDNALFLLKKITQRIAYIEKKISKKMSKR